MLTFCQNVQERLADHDQDNYPYMDDTLDQRNRSVTHANSYCSQGLFESTMLAQVPPVLSQCLLFTTFAP